MARGRVRLDTLVAERAETVPGHGTATLSRLAVGQIAPTPMNKRRNFDPGKLAELGASLRAEQLQPVVAVPRRAYLALWPAHEELIGDALFVLANGERRYRAALQVGLDALDVLVREELADSRARFLRAVGKENLDRENLDAIEEAETVEVMVAECGTAAAAAKELGRTQGWVSQRRALLRLTPELQDRVRSGDLPVRLARTVATLAPAEQEAGLTRMLAEQAASAEARQQAPPPSPPAPVPAPAPPPPADSPTPPPPIPATPSPTPAPGPSGQSPPSQNAPSGPGPSGAGAEPGRPVPPVSNPAPGPGPAPEGIPWGSPPALAILLRQRLSEPDLKELVTLLTTPGD